MTFERRDEITNRTETPSVFSHTVSTTVRHSFSKEEVIEALGLEVPEGHSVSLSVRESDTTYLDGYGQRRPWKLLVHISNTEVRS